MRARTIIAFTCITIAVTANAAGAGADDRTDDTTTTVPSTTDPSGDATTTTTVAPEPTTSSTRTATTAPPPVSAPPTSPPVHAAAVCTACNGKIAFTSNRDTGHNQIYVMQPDGTNQRRLTFTGASESGPAWSPDGTKIAFYSFRDGNFEIYVMNADGTNQTRLTTNPSFDVQPAWSPDGSLIAFMSGRDNNFEIYVMNADGTNAHNVTNNSADDEEPAWSPGSSPGSNVASRILFISRRDGNPELYSMAPDGTDQTRGSMTGDQETAPAWSPDVFPIAYGRWVPGSGGVPGDIFVKGVFGGETNLTNTPLTDEHSPAWSPDGSLMAFSTNRDVNSEIYTMRSYDGFGPTNHSNNGAQEYEPSWQRTRPRPDASIRSQLPATDTFVGDDRYEGRSNLATQVKSANAHRLQSVGFVVNAQQEIGSGDTFKVLGTGGDAKFKVHYFFGATDISTAVKHGTFRLPVAAGFAGRNLRVVVKARGASHRANIKQVLVTLTSTVNPADKDTVRAQVTRV